MNRIYFIKYGWEDEKGGWQEAERNNIPTKEEAQTIAEELEEQGYEVEIDYERV
jgi:hypothetical protein